MMWLPARVESTGLAALATAALHFIPIRRLKSSNPTALPSHSERAGLPEIPMTQEQALEGLTSLTLQELKRKPPTEILALAESLEIEGANTLRTQDMLLSLIHI